MCGFQPQDESSILFTRSKGFMPTIDVVVFKCTDDWKAILADNPFVFAFGKSKEETVGRLVIQSGSSMAISVQVQKGTQKAK